MDWNRLVFSWADLSVPHICMFTCINLLFTLEFDSYVAVVCHMYVTFGCPNLKVVHDVNIGHVALSESTCLCLCFLWQQTPIGTRMEVSAHEWECSLSSFCVCLYMCLFWEQVQSLTGWSCDCYHRWENETLVLAQLLNIQMYTCSESPEDMTEGSNLKDALLCMTICIRTRNVSNCLLVLNVSAQERSSEFNRKYCRYP